MENLIEYLSGNVPGGIGLYFLVILTVFFVLLFMRRVNELFNRKHFYRWLIISVLFITILYVFIWVNDPPYQINKRYTVDLFESNTKDNWLGHYLTQLISASLQPFKSKRHFSFPYYWLYHITPTDSIDQRPFRQRIYSKMPVHSVLSGSIEKHSEKITAELVFYRYPSGKIVKKSKTWFQLKDISLFLEWVRKEFGDLLPFVSQTQANVIVPLDSVLELGKWNFFRGNYRQAEKLLIRKSGKTEIDRFREMWLQYTRIRLAGLERQANPPKNLYLDIQPEWQKKLQAARSVLLKLLREGFENPMANLMIAESFIWEEEFSNAEVFLEKAYIDNPFNIDVLFNLSFLHPSRYREFGFNGVREIYQKILAIDPIEETVLLKWSQYILENHPAYTPSPNFAKDFLERYLKINPYSPEVWNMLGEIYSRQAQRAAALQAFQKADSLLPKNGRINYNIGVLYYEWGKLNEAKIYFQRAIDYGDYLDAHLYLGAIFLDEGKYKKALERFRYRVKHKKGDNDLYAYQAMKGIQQCLKAMGEPLNSEVKK